MKEFFLKMIGGFALLGFMGVCFYTYAHGLRGGSKHHHSGEFAAPQNIDEIKGEYTTPKHKAKKHKKHREDY